MSRAIIILFAILGSALLVFASQVTPERVPEQPGLVRGLLLFFGGSALLISLATWMLDSGSKIVAKERAQFIATALPGTARVLRVESRSGGNDSYVRAALTLEVTIPGRPTYVTTYESSVEMVFTGRLRPGEWLPVLVSPEDSQELLIRWEEAATPPVGAVR